MIEPLVYLSAQGTLGIASWGRDLVNMHKQLFDYDKKPDEFDRLYVVPINRLQESPPILTTTDAMRWSPDPRILMVIKSHHAFYLEALKSCPDRATLERVASLLYYSAELGVKIGNPNYMPTRFQMGTEAGMENMLVFQHKGGAAAQKFMEMADDMLCYHWDRELSSLSALQAKSVQALESCGLEEVPGIIDWIQNET